MVLVQKNVTQTNYFVEKNLNNLGTRLYASYKYEMSNKGTYFSQRSYK